ncbi:MAG TPA: monovalent cation/H+ antiporter subunit D family protein [Methanomicrobia archaeon]|nr:monovalent cation/H+ antiporter subunit D family protein [Methanomicrobia archaeon]
MTLIEQFPVLLVAVGVFSAFTILVVGWKAKKTCFFIFAAAISVQFIMSLFILNHVLTIGTIQYWLGGWMPPWGIEYVVDALNAYILVIVLFMGLICAIYSKRTVEHEIEKGKHIHFYTLFQLLIAGMCGVVLTGDMFNLYVFYEIASLTAYALIASASGRAFRASYTYLIMGAIGISFYLLGVGFLYAETGSLNMHDVSLLLPPLYGSRVVQAAFVFFFTGLSIKLGLFPLHMWKPDAYTYSPSGISVVLSAAMSTVTVYVLVRVIYSVFTLEFIRSYVGMDITICWIAAIGIIAGSVLAIMQHNLKKMLAYSSISQMGYFVLGIGLSPISSWGLLGAVAHLSNHTIMKGCLFMAAGAFIYKYGLWDIRDFDGLGKKMPYASAAFTLAAISMIGVPPSAGFVTKLFLILAALHSTDVFYGYAYVFVAVILLSSLLNLVYFWRVIERMYFVKHEEEQTGEVKGSDAPMSMLMPLLLLAALSIVIGIVWLTKIPLPFIADVLSELGLGGLL